MGGATGFGLRGRGPGCAWSRVTSSGCGGTAARTPRYLHHQVAPAVGRAVVDHGDDGHAQVAADAKADAESQTAHDGDNVAAREAEAGAVHHRRVLRLRRDRAPVGTQLQSLCTFLPLLQKAAGQQESKTRTSRAQPPPPCDTGVQGKTSCLKKTQDST